MRNSHFILSLSATFLVTAYLVGQNADTASAQEVSLQATLGGSEEVPAVTTSASGTFTATLNADRTALSFELSVSNATGVTQAHPHCGAAGETGPVAAFLFGEGMAPGDAMPSPPPAGLVDPGVHVDGTLSTGTLTADNLIGEGACAASFDAFVDALLNGQVYINVHSETYPPGEIRCQVAQVQLPATGGPPPASGDGLSALWYALIAAGALAMIGGGTLTLALRRHR